MRLTAAAPAVVLAFVVLGGCTDRAAEEIPAEGPWVVGLSSSGDALGVTPALECFDDEAVSEYFATADMPGSGASGTIGADRTPTDVQRIVDCIQRVAPKVDVVVTSRAP